MQTIECLVACHLTVRGRKGYERYLLRFGPSGGEYTGAREEAITKKKKHPFGSVSIN